MEVKRLARLTARGPYVWYPGFDSDLISFYLEFACPPCTPVGSLWVLRVPATRGMTEIYDKSGKWILNGRLDEVSSAFSSNPTLSPVPTSAMSFPLSSAHSFARSVTNVHHSHTTTFHTHWQTGELIKRSWETVTFPLAPSHFPTPFYSAQKSSCVAGWAHTTYYTRSICTWKIPPTYTLKQSVSKETYYLFSPPDGMFFFSWPPKLWLPKLQAAKLKPFHPV